MAYGFDDDKSKVEVYNKTESDAKYRTKTEIAKYDGTFASPIDILTDHWYGTGSSMRYVNYDYTAPADGFVMVSRTSGAPSSGDVTVYPSADSDIKIKAGSDTGTAYMSLYVKKGTVLHVQATSPTASYTNTFIARFHPYKIV